MIGKLSKYLQFMALVFRHGNLKTTRENINNVRATSLATLTDFVPRGSVVVQSVAKKNILRFITGQLAFLKNSLNPRGGHLQAGDLSYIRIGKAANTSISKAMLEKMYPALKQHSITEAQINFLADVNLSTENEGTQVFTVVRNPFSRLVSVYRDFFENKKNEFVYQDYLFGVLSRDLSFPEFIDRISAIPDRLKDQHIKPQHLILRYYDQKKVPVKVFKLEETAALEQFLSHYSMQLPHLNKSGEGYDYRSYYTPDLVAKVSALYAVDISRFGYENALQELVKHSKTVHK